MTEPGVCQGVDVGRSVSNGRAVGDDAALSAWCRDSWPRLVRAVMPWCDDVGQAEDIAQEALARAVTRFDRTAEIGPIAWVTTVAMNLARSRLRRLRVERRHAGPAARAVSPGPTPDVLAVIDALRSLPTRQRAAVALRYLGDLSVDETAQVMGCSSATVKTHVRDAFVTLRVDPNLRDHHLIGEPHGTG